MGRLGTRSKLEQAVGAFTSNWRNPNLRRAQLSFLGAWTAEWAFTVALGIVAYNDGGAFALGLVGLLRMLPSAILAPVLSPYADRGRRERVLVTVSLLRGAATAAAAVVVAVSGPVLVVYALAVLSTIAATLFRPAHSALLPTLSHTGHELASANVARPNVLEWRSIMTRWRSFLGRSRAVAYPLEGRILFGTEGQVGGIVDARQSSRGPSDARGPRDRIGGARS